MGRYIKFFFAVVLTSVVLFYSCIDDQFDAPPINELPIGSVITIQTLRDLCPPGNAFKFHGDSSVYAVVTMDEKSGNIYKNVFVQDATGGVNLRFTASSGLYEGDSIRIYLKGAKLSWYNNLFQVDSLHPDSSVIKQATNRHRMPQVVTIPELKSDLSYWQSRLIKIDGVQVVPSDTTKTWADPAGLQYGEITLQDTLGNTIMVRSSGYAKFAGQKVPKGFGSITAVMGLYRETIQLALRRTSEADMNGERWVDSTNPPSGNGTFDNPYNVAYAMLNNSGMNKWVQGYIVGVIETTADPFVASFEPPFTTNSNLLIADSPNETNQSKCLTVQLPAGAIRDALNLVTKPENQGKQVMLYGNLEAYFSQPGIKSLTGYWLDGNGIIPTVGFYEENFTSSLGSFTAHNIVGAQVWGWGNFDGGCAVMSGFVNPNNFDNEDWLVSPAIDLSGRNNVKMNIREAINYINPTTGLDDMQILISVNYTGGDPTASGTWTKLTGFNRPAGNSWTFVDSGDIDLSLYDGMTIRVAFKYISTSTKAATWEVSKVQLTESNK